MQCFLFSHHLVAVMSLRGRMHRAASDVSAEPPIDHSLLTTRPKRALSNFDEPPTPPPFQPSASTSPPSASTRLPSTRGVTTLHTPPQPPPPPYTPSTTAAFHRAFLSPMDRLFIAFFEPATLNTDAWANLPSPAPTPSPGPMSPFVFSSSPPPPSATHRYLPSIGYMLLLLLAVLLRVLTSGHPYSGQHSPPIYGDYEAQRHWMELTLHLPATLWYFYDLPYWGLDYPPLTAYVSWLCGWLFSWIEPGMVAFERSRGYESETSKFLMRLSVLFCDLLCFIPAVVLFTRLHYRHTKTTTAHALMLFITFIHPAYLLIDHGHFQYNCVVLGLVTYAIVGLCSGWQLMAAVLFCLALSFKQMALYYAPVFFVFLLSDACARSSSLVALIVRVSLLGGTVISTFTLMLLPWLLTSSPLLHIRQILHRLFPVARGLYEDKVANFWCATSLFIKWPQLFDRELLISCSILLTLLAFLPSLIHLFLFPSHTNLLYSLTITAFAFYFFSFQVHEKTILLPLLPVSLLFCEHPLLSSWVGYVATFSMFPLLVRDRLEIAYAASGLLYVCIVGGMIGSIPLRSERREVTTVVEERGSDSDGSGGKGGYTDDEGAPNVTSCRCCCACCYDERGACCCCKGGCCCKKQSCCKDKCCDERGCCGCPCCADNQGRCTCNCHQLHRSTASIKSWWQPNESSGWVVWLDAHKPSTYNYLYPYISILSLLSLFTAIVVHVIAFFVPRLLPDWWMLHRWPDVMTFLFVEFSFVHFLGFWLFVYWLQLTSVRGQTNSQTLHHEHVE